MQPTSVASGWPGRVARRRRDLSGTVDMRTYQRKYLVVYAPSPGGFIRGPDLVDPDYRGLLAMLTDCVEWLDEHFGWELVNVFSREYEAWSCYYAMLRRSRSN